MHIQRINPSLDQFGMCTVSVWQARLISEDLSIPVAERACNNTFEYDTYILQEFNLLVALIMKNDNVGNSDDLNKHFEGFRLIDDMLALILYSDHN